MKTNPEEVKDKAAKTLSIGSVEYQLGYKEALTAAAQAAEADGVDLPAQSPTFAAIQDLALKNWQTPAKPGPDFSGNLQVNS